MNAFGTSDLDWRRPDVSAIVQQHGLGCVTVADHAAHRAWLAAHSYTIIAVDCRSGLATILDRFNELFHWEQKFGYLLSADRANLDALRDGFEFEVSRDEGVVLELTGIDALYESEPRWTSGLLAIASQHSAYQLALGRRFFCLLVLEPDSHLVGVSVDTVSVPVPYWNPSGKLPLDRNAG